jgi:thymidylate synthase ThyX
MPPEQCAYALARYSRSPDSIRDSIAWVRSHDAKKFLESFYFQYGHASIADLGHLTLCFEGISELAAAEIEDEALWDGQARSSRYQNFARSGVVTPPEFDDSHRARYLAETGALIAAYTTTHAAALVALRDRLPRPGDMKPDAYERNLAARAFDVARYLLPFGVPTGVGQITSIRTLERQVRRLRTSPYAELRDLAAEIAAACEAPPDLTFEGGPAHPVAPTLARHLEPDEHSIRSREDLKTWAAQNLPPRPPHSDEMVSLTRADDVPADIAATLLYPVTHWPYAALYEFTRSAGAKLRAEIVDAALRSRTPKDDLLRGFRGGPYVFDLVIDIGAYRDLHRHRRCHQFRQTYTGDLGFSTPPLLAEIGLAPAYSSTMSRALAAARDLPAPGSHYLLPLGTRSRFLFKMDFAEAEYIARLRSGVKGHFSYREAAWLMKEKMEQLEPELGRLIQATPPWVEDPLRR